MRLLLADRRGPMSAISWVVWPILLVALVFLTQMTDLQVEVIDWDESTFLLMANEVLHGHLPYVSGFDNKPPFMFLALAAFLAPYGKSLFVARLFGDLCLAIIAILSFKIAEQRSGQLAVALGAGMLIAFSTLGFANHTQPEHLAMALVMGALLCAMRSNSDLSSAAGAGALMSLAVLTRSNLILTAAALGLYYAIAFFFPRDRTNRLSIFAFVIGGLVPLALLFLVYALNGALPELLLALVDVPAAYATGQLGPLDALRAHYGDARQLLSREPIILWPFIALSVWGGIVLGVQLLSSAFRRGATLDDDALIIVLTGAATFASVMLSGAAYPHYWNQLAPFAAILIAWALAAHRRHFPSFLILIASCTVAIVYALSMHASSSLHVVRHWSDLEAQHPLRRIASRIAEDRAPGDAVWALEGHLILWYLDQQSVSRAAVHPSNLFRPTIIRTLEDADYVPKNEFQRVLQALPRYVVYGAKSFYLRERQDEFLRWLGAGYDPWIREKEFVVYRRKG